MAKPGKPLLSLGARGTISDTLTFQKRGKGSSTIARRKPIPENPRSQAQLAQRKRYSDAVDLWNALSPEEKEAWRGVCPGLTAYQCFIRSELRKVVAPPEEYTEEQTEHDTPLALYTGERRRAGQILTIPNRKVTKLGFWLYRLGSPTDDVTFEIRRVSDDSLISTYVWGDAADLSTEITYEEVEFPDPQIINEEVRICTHYYGGNTENYVAIRFESGYVKDDEELTHMPNLTWYNVSFWDCAYRYKYYLP